MDTINHVEVFKAAFLAFLGDNTTDLVEKRDGSSATLDYAKIPADILITFLPDGAKEYVRDSASAALSNAYDIAHPKHELTGDKLKSARVKWVGTDSNVFKVRDESSAIMEAAISRVEAGERRVSRASGPVISEIDSAIYDAAFNVKGVPAFALVAKAFKDAKGMNTGERQALVLSVVKDDLPEPLRVALGGVALAHIESMAVLAQAGIDLDV